MKYLSIILLIILTGCSKTTDSDLPPKTNAPDNSIPKISGTKVFNGFYVTQQGPYDRPPKIDTHLVNNIVINFTMFGDSILIVKSMDSSYLFSGDSLSINYLDIASSMLSFYKSYGHTADRTVYYNSDKDSVSVLHYYRNNSRSGFFSRNYYLHNK